MLGAAVGFGPLSQADKRRKKSNHETPGPQQGTHSPRTDSQTGGGVRRERDVEWGNRTVKKRVVVVMTGRNGRGMMRLTEPGGDGAEATHEGGVWVVWYGRQSRQFTHPMSLPLRLSIARQLNRKRPSDGDGMADWTGLDWTGRWLNSSVRTVGSNETE